MDKMKKHIMVVDDEPDIVELVKILLEKEGYEIISASSADECLKKLKKVAPDLILLDIMMPGMPVKKMLERIRKNKKWRNIKIIYLTVVRMSEAEKSNLLQEANIVDFIEKPFDITDLVRRVKKAL
jgi:DNA-binding response OmpR family regulator